jgi:xylulokinase
MEGIVVFTGQPVKRDEMLKRLYPCYPGYRENVSLSVNLTSGSILKWYRDEVSSQSGRSSSGGSFDEILGGIDVNGPGDLLLIPHFAGTCNPRFNPDARGLVYGLSLHSSMGDMVQGILEGLCYELRLHIQGLGEAGIHIGKLKAVGGGSQSPSWLQLKANITGLEVIGSDAHEASSMGAAGLCGSALGLLNSPFAVGQAAGVHECVYMPKADAGEAFEEKYARYVELVARLYGEN